MKKEITEIFDNVFRLSIAPCEHFEFNQFLLIDTKVCLVHTGKLSFFEALLKMAKEELKGRRIDYIVFSHFEADECGSINNWLNEYQSAQVVCNKIANINLSDFLKSPAQVLKDGDILNLGKRQLKLIETPHFPHNWDAHMWLEETESILFSSDFCCHGGISEPIAEVENSKEVIQFYEKGKFIPYGKSTNQVLEKLSNLNIENIVPMHGSVLKGAVAKSVFSAVKIDLDERSKK